VTNITAKPAGCWHSLSIRLALQGQCTPAGPLPTEESRTIIGSLARSGEGEKTDARESTVGQLANAASSAPGADASRDQSSVLPDVKKSAREHESHAAAFPQGAPRSAFQGARAAQFGFTPALARRRYTVLDADYRLEIV
jgi:hypothetical protein